MSRNPANTKKLSAKKAISRFLFALLLFVSIFPTVLLLPPKHSKQGYMSAIVDKQKLVDSEKRRKIVLIGGSNLAFGIDSAQLERSAGLPVINMGVHAGLGLRFMTSDALPRLRANDVAIVFPEFEQFDGMSGGLAAQHLQVIESNPLALAAGFDLGHAQLVVSGLPAYVKNKFKYYQFNFSECLNNIRTTGKCDHQHVKIFEPKLPYLRSAFNENGDVTVHWLYPSLGITGQTVAIPDTPDAEAITVLNSFADACEKQNITVAFCFPAIPRSVYCRKQSQINAFAGQLKSLLHMPILGHPSDFSLPDEQFFDTCYHLRKAGIDKRMSTLSSEMRKAMPQLFARIRANN